MAVSRRRMLCKHSRTIQERCEESAVSYLVEGYHSDRPVAAAMPSERVSFIQRTYGHLAGTILAFAGLETLLIQSGIAKQFTETMFTGGKGGMLLLMLVFIGGGYLAQSW